MSQQQLAVAKKSRMLFSLTEETWSEVESLTCWIR